MKVIKSAILSISLAIAVTQLQGCLVAAVGAGIAAVKYGNAKKTEAQAKSQQSYNEYVLGMQKINITRQKEKLQPERIMTFDEYSPQR